MKVELKIDNNYKTPLCVIYTDQITEEIKSYITKLSCTTQNTVTGKSGDNVSIINQNDIINIYASNGKVFAVTDRGEFTVTQRLYELENSLDYNKFVRISKSEIINLEKSADLILKFQVLFMFCLKTEKAHMFQEDMYQKLKKDWVYKMSIKKQLLIRGLIGVVTPKS